MQKPEEYSPQIFPDLESLKNSAKDFETVDGVKDAIEDLFKIDFPFVAPGSPEYQKTYQKYLAKIGNLNTLGVWVFFPWRKTAVYLPKEDDYFKLRTARNKFLITREEQEKFYNSKIAIAGLSVGSSVLNAIVLSGGSKNMKIADNDTLAIVNLNRLFSSVCDLGRSKAVASARRAHELNPFQQLEVYADGLTTQNIDAFLGEGESKIDLFIEEMDNIKLKIDSRFAARKKKIPVIMATDNGDNTIIDVERFDLEPNRPLFHGSVKESILTDVPENPPLADKVRLANSIVGPNVTPRTRLSLTLVGAKIPAWPQLGNAANLSGVVTSYVARRILVGDKMPSGRYEVNLDMLIDPDYQVEEKIAERVTQKNEFVKGFELLFGE